MSNETAKPKTSLAKGSDIKASKANVVQQVRLMESAGTSWFAVKHGNLEMITRLFPSQCNVYSKGPVGDNCFHVALLLNTPSTLAIAKYLVKLYGKTLVNTPYQERKHELDTPGHYEGETGLHIAIVNRDFDMVKFLIQAGADVRARCYGAFFQPGTVMYYGEYPLSFAACTGQKDIVSYLKRHGARVNHDRDTHGNTALHLCVHHDQMDMYEHLVEYCGALEHVRNNRGMTPLLLAASLGKLEFFQHIYNRRRMVAWAYGPVTSYSLSLHEIDTVQNRRPFVPSAVETIVRKGHKHMVDDPLVRTLLTTKWQRFAGLQFAGQALLYLCLMILQTFLVWLHCSPSKFNSESREALEVCCLILTAGFLILEAVDVGMWAAGVSHRRSLMKANAKYCPPLYPIPGETHEAPVKAKSGLGQGLQRLFKGRGKGNKGEGEPVGEGVEVQVVGEAMGAAQFVPWSPEHTQDEGGQCEGGCPQPGQPGLEGSGRHQQQQGQWVQGAAWGATLAAGPVAEGTDRPSVQFQQVDDVGVADEQGVAATASSVSSPTGRQAMGRVPSMRGSRASTTTGLLNPEVDIVSVGLASAPPLRTQPSFFMQAAPSNPMMQHPSDAAALFGEGFGGSGAGHHLGDGPSPSAWSEPSRPRMGASGSTGGAGLVAGTSGDRERASGVRETSEIVVGVGGQEIRNRLRGGGGGDMPSTRSQSMRRNDSKKAGPGEREDALPTDDDREPLHVAGFWGALGTLAHALASYYRRQARDPVTLLMLSHQVLTLIHFITWASTYGGINGDGPSSSRVRQFDDIIVSLMALTGWVSMLFFARCAEWSGTFAVVIETCGVEVVKFAGLYFLFNMGYTLAFYAVLNGTTQAVEGAKDHNLDLDLFPVPHPFSSIGTGMMQLLRFMYGEAEYETYSASAYKSKQAVATCYFILYLGTVLLLLVNLLVALLVHTYGSAREMAGKTWKLRWALYVIRAEARLPHVWQQRYRVGQVAYDPALQQRVYNHVFEMVDDDKGEGGDAAREKEVKALEAVLARLRKGGNGKGGA